MKANKKQSKTIELGAAIVKLLDGIPSNTAMAALKIAKAVIGERLKAPLLGNIRQVPSDVVEVNT